MNAITPISTSQTSHLKLDPSLFDDNERFDIYISCHGDEALDHIGCETNGMTTQDFVQNHLIPELQNIWKERGYKGSLEIFSDNGIHGIIDNAVFGAIKTLQVHWVFNSIT